MLCLVWSHDLMLTILTSLKRVLPPKRELEDIYCMVADFNGIYKVNNCYLAKVTVKCLIKIR